MKKFEIPFNFDLNLLNFLDEKIDKNKIEFLFLSAFKEDSDNARSHVENVKKDWGTYKVPNTRQEYSKYIENMQIRGYNPAILFQEEQCINKEKLQYYFDLNIKNFIVNNDELAYFLKNKDSSFNVVASITKTLSLKDLWEKDLSMYDKIVLHFPFNRALCKLNCLPQQYKYVLLVNSYCSYNCTEAKKHWNSNTEEALNIYCARVDNKDKLIYIPPEYLYLFEPYVSNFKLQGREYSTEYLAKEIYYFTNILHNPQCGAIYNRLSPFNAEEYFNKAKNLDFVNYNNLNPNSPSPFPKNFAS